MLKYYVYRRISQKAIYIYMCILLCGSCVSTSFICILFYVVIRLFKRKKKSSIRNNINIFIEKTIIMCTYWQYIYSDSVWMPTLSTIASIFIVISLRTRHRVLCFMISYTNFLQWTVCSGVRKIRKSPFIRRFILESDDICVKFMNPTTRSPPKSNC